jgi:hypothetical protein
MAAYGEIWLAIDTSPGWYRAARRNLKRGVNQRHAERPGHAQPSGMPADRESTEL